MSIFQKFHAKPHSDPGSVAYFILNSAGPKSNLMIQALNHRPHQTSIGLKYWLTNGWFLALLRLSFAVLSNILYFGTNSIYGKQNGIL